MRIVLLFFLSSQRSFFFLSTEYLQIHTTPIYVTCMSHVCVGQSLQLTYKSLQIHTTHLQIPTNPYNSHTTDMHASSLTYTILYVPYKNIQLYLCDIQNLINCVCHIHNCVGSFRRGQALVDLVWWNMS